MKVYFRNVDDANSAFVGDMNMEELNDFIYSIRAEGFYVVKNNENMDLMYPQQVRRYFYYETEKDFWVEILWWDDGQE